MELRSTLCEEDLRVKSKGFLGHRAPSLSCSWKGRGKWAVVVILKLALFNPVSNRRLRSGLEGGKMQVWNSVKPCYVLCSLESLVFLFQ